MYAGAWVAGLLGRATQTSAIFLQNGLSHFPVLSRAPFVSHSPTGFGFVCLYPTTNLVHFSHEVFVVGLLCECSLELNVKFLTWTQKELNTHLQAFGCELTVFYFWFTVEPPSDLKFKILNENTVEMSWLKPSSRIEGFRIQVASDAGQCFRRMDNANSLNPMLSPIILEFAFHRWTKQRFHPWCILNLNLHH